MMALPNNTHNTQDKPNNEQYGPNDPLTSMGLGMPSSSQMGNQYHPFYHGFPMNNNNSNNQGQRKTYTDEQVKAAIASAMAQLQGGVDQPKFNGASSSDV